VLASDGLCEGDNVSFPNTTEGDNVILRVDASLGAADGDIVLFSFADMDNKG
jgi:hypothetical protein